MARHRINENGHMIWFDNDEEYRQYQKRKAIPGIIIGVIMGIWAIVAAFELSRDNKQEPTEVVQDAFVTEISSEDKNAVQLTELPDVEIEGKNENLVDQSNFNVTFEELLSKEGEKAIVENSMVTNLEEKDFSKRKVYDIVDEMPVFPGGDNELLKYIEDNLEFPQEAIDGGVHGRVFVNIIVEPDGSISNAKIIRGIGSGCDEEAVRVIESMPHWNPGRRKGEEVRVSMTIPVSFKLQE